MMKYNNVFEQMFFYLLIGVPSLLIVSMLLGSVFLPKENLSHQMNPFSITKYWLLEDTSRIELVVKYGVGVLLLFVITTPFVNMYLKSRKKGCTNPEPKEASN